MNALRRIRKARRLTLAEVARRAGLTPERVCQIEAGTKVPKTWGRLARLADVLGVTADEVLGRVPPRAALVPIDALAREDRELLDKMRDDAEQLLGPRVLALIGGWRGIARMSWLGLLTRARHNGLDRPHAPAPEAQQVFEDATKRRRQIAAAKAAL